MKHEEYLDIFRQTGALLEGHFGLTSGRHSSSYFQCAKVLQHPKYLNLFSKTISDHFKTLNINTVISPAVGGIVIGTRVGGDLDKKTIFAEREDGNMILRRGFSIAPGEKILVVEDVITTGGSVKEVMQAVEELGGEVVGVGIIVGVGCAQATCGGGVGLFPGRRLCSALAIYRRTGSRGPLRVPPESRPGG